MMDLTVYDTANYTCVLSNEHGQISFITHLIVTGSLIMPLLYHNNDIIIIRSFLNLLTRIIGYPTGGIIMETLFLSAQYK